MTVRDVLPRDAIPSVDDPAFGPGYAGAPDDEVVVLDGDPPRAYPLRVLGGHEVVNDAVDGRPVAVTWCPICWSTAVYDRRVDGRVLTFGVSGKLVDDALVLYDRETGTEWKQPTGEAIAGALAGRRLTPVPAPVVPHERFAADHPAGVALKPPREGDLGAAYDMGRYEAYAAGEAFGLHGMRGTGEPRSWERSDLAPKTLVLGVEHGGAAVGYPLPRVRAAGGVVTDAVGGLEVAVFAAGGSLHAFENPGLSFRAEEGAVRADGTTWDGVTGEAADGRRLRRLPATRLFAFAWQDAHGPDAFYDRS